MKIRYYEFNRLRKRGNEMMDYTSIKEKMEKTINVYTEKLSEVRAGRANPAILN